MGILSCVLLYRLSKTVCFLESSLPIHRRTRPSPHSDDSGNFHGPVCAGSTRRSHCLRPPGRVWRSGADQPRERVRKFPRFREGEGFVLRTLLHTYLNLLHIIKQRQLIGLGQVAEEAQVAHEVDDRLRQLASGPQVIPGQEGAVLGSGFQLIGCLVAQALDGT